MFEVYAKNDRGQGNAPYSLIVNTLAACMSYSHIIPPEILPHQYYMPLYLPYCSCPARGQGHI